jgi:hypothetical protein
LGGGARVVAGLAERFAGEVGHLVGADDHGLGEAGGHGAGLFQRQAHGQVARRFAGQRCFVDFGGCTSKGSLEAGQQFAAVARGRGEDHGALHGTIVREPLKKTVGAPSDLCGSPRLLWRAR